MIIVKAAIMYEDGEIVEGRNYGDIAALAGRLGYNNGKFHGFMTSAGGFVLPEEAATIARSSGQFKGTNKYLVPDDLWPERVELENVD